MIKRNALIATICCSALPLAAQTSEAFTDSIMRNYMLEEVVVPSPGPPRCTLTMTPGISAPAI